MSLEDDSGTRSTRELLDDVMSGSVHVDWQDHAHAQQTLLMKLCYFDPGEDSMLEILDNVFALDPNVNLRDGYNRTAFAHACIAQNYTMADALLYMDSTLIDTEDLEQCSPLVYAIRAEDEHMVDKILSHPKSTKANLLSVWTKGKSPLELAMSQRNPVIIDALKRYSCYTRDSSNRRVTTHNNMAGVSVNTKVRVPLTHPFITTKSHSDPLLLRRVKDREETTGTRCSSGHACPEMDATDSKQPKSSRKCFQSRKQREANRSNELLPSLTVPPRHERRGSLSLPDLSDLPDVIARVEVATDSSTGDNSSSDHEISFDSDEENDLDTEVFVEEAEILRRREAARHRRNSVSLPDLFSKTLTVSKGQNCANSLQNSPSGTLTHLPPLLTNEHKKAAQCSDKSRDLKLPAIQMCSSPSLPSLDRKSLRRQSLKKHHSSQNLNISVRTPICSGESDNLRRILLDRRKDSAILKSVT